MNIEIRSRLHLFSFTCIDLTPIFIFLEYKDTGIVNLSCISSGSSTFAINTAAKPVYKLSTALQGILTFGQFEWFTDAQHTERLSFASELVWFLIDNGNTNENIEFVLMAIDAVMDGMEVDYNTSNFVDKEPVKTYMGISSDFKNLLDNSPRAVGKFKG